MVLTCGGRPVLREPKGCFDVVEEDGFVELLQHE